MSVDSPPISDSEHAVQLRRVILRLARRVRPTAAAAAAGLSPSRATILLDIDRRGPLRLAEVVLGDGFNPTMVSRTISDLTADDLVSRTADARDRRSGWVRATPRGHRLAERIRRERAAALNRALAELAAEDRRTIVAALPAFAALADQLEVAL